MSSLQLGGDLLWKVCNGLPQLAHLRGQQGQVEMRIKLTAMGRVALDALSCS